MSSSSYSIPFICTANNWGNHREGFYQSLISFSPSINMPPPLRYMRTSAGFQVKMGLDFLMFSHFAAYFLGHPLCNQIDTDGSTRSPTRKGFVQRESKWPNNIARTAMKKHTMSSEIAMDNLNLIVAQNYFQSTGTNACYEMQNSTNQPNQPLQRSINSLSSAFWTTVSLPLCCFVISGNSQHSSYVEISSKLTYCQCLQPMNGVA